MPDKMKESDLAIIVMDWLVVQGYEVYQEVQFKVYGRVADIVAVKDNTPLIIECKMGWGLRVLEQAAAWAAPYRAVAVPAPKQKRRDYRIAWNYFHVGVIQIGLSEQCKFISEPPLRIQYQNAGEQIVKHLSEWHKTHGEAGSRNSHLTPYRLMELKIREKLRTTRGGMTLNDIVDTVGIGHYQDRTSCKGAIRTMLNEATWVWISRRNTKQHIYYHA